MSTHVRLSSIVPARFLRPLAVANLVANILIVVTGGVVRLTGSGLGCPTWPRCTEDSYVAHEALGINGAIEFGNRMLTWVLVAVAIACWLAALAHRASAGANGDRSVRLATLIALYVPAQAIIGGITVLTDLNPYVVAFHLLVSMALIGLCVLLVEVTRHSDTWAAGSPERAPTQTRRLGWLIYGVGWVVLWLGTLVTGSGPHAGDLDARRTGLDPQVWSHVHASAVYVLVALTLGMLALAHRQQLAGVRRAAGALLLVELLQGVVGFVQYFNDLPVPLVTVHMLGASLTAAAMAWVVVRAQRTV
ncbi:COX15/CtaA family protein [Nocardioides jensenii]|uniref:COX15/CtaA family protein n=1 Tax=Nocardioides jensenii TaxID=1843 RepID=UPI001FE0C224|nr:COX15/CtaA family protein [Nocardioides jensenii]